MTVSIMHNNNDIGGSTRNNLFFYRFLKSFQFIYNPTLTSLNRARY